MKNILLLVFVLFLSSTLFSQINIDNDNYKFHIEFNKNWKAGNKVETDKKDVINYSFSKVTKKDTMTSAIIAFKFTAPTNIDDFIYKLEKDFNLNIPEKTNGYKNISGDVYEGKSADYKDTETIEKIYYYTTTKDIAGEYFCYMIRFIADSKYKLVDFNTEVTNIANTFKVKL
jgi:hypothetical protein